MKKEMKSFIVLLVMLCCLVPISGWSSTNCNGRNCDNQTPVYSQQGQTQGQLQRQDQKQNQGQSQYSSVRSTVKTSVNSGQIVAPSQIINEEKELLTPPQISPVYLYPLQGGKIVDYTQYLPKFAHTALKPLQETDIVVEVLDVYFGNIFNRITFEEVEQVLLEKAKNYDGSKGDIRFKVRFQESVINGGTGGGGAVSAASNSGYTANTAAILPGITKSTYNPIFHITFYRIAVTSSEAIITVTK